MKFEIERQRQVEEVVEMLASGKTVEDIERETGLTVWGVADLLASKMARRICRASMRVGRVQSQLLVHRFLAHAMTRLIGVLEAEKPEARLKAIALLVELAQEARSVKKETGGAARAEMPLLPLENAGELMEAIVTVVQQKGLPGVGDGK